MTIVIRRPVGVFVGLAAAAALLTACGSGPSQVGTALIVGNTSVSVNQVQQELNDLLSTQSAARQAQQQGLLSQTSRGIVTGHVLHELLQRVAGQEQLAVSEPQIDQLISSSGGIAKVADALGTDQANTRDAVKDVLLEAQLARKYASTLAVKFGYIITTSRQEAIDKARQLAANPNSLNDMVSTANAQAQAGGQQGAAGATDLTWSIPTYLQTIQNSEQQTGQTSSENDGPIFGTPANTALVYQPVPQGAGWLVVLVKSRDTSAAVPSGNPSALNSASLTTLQQIGVSMLQSEANTLGVRVSPRYGVWNQVGMQVVASTDQNAGMEFPVRTSQP